MAKGARSVGDGLVPSVVDELIEPLLLPQVELLGVRVVVGEVDVLIVVLAVVVHPLASVTVTEQLPVERFVIVDVVAALLHKYV